jgi:hypothetical protein
MATSTGRYRILGINHAAILLPGTPATPPNFTPITEHDLHFINNVGYDIQQQDVAFEGDQQSVRKYFLNGMVINVVCDTVDIKAVSEAFNKQVVVGTGTTSSDNNIPTGVKRVYFGDSGETAGVKCGFLAQMLAEDLTTQDIVTLKFVAPITALTIVRPPTFAYNAKAQLSLTFTAEKTETDIAGNALADVPDDGAFWYLDEISA